MKKQNTVDKNLKPICDFLANLVLFIKNVSRPVTVFWLMYILNLLY